MLASDQEAFYPYYEDTVTESDSHFAAITYLLGALRQHLADRPADWAFANMFVYDQPGNRARKVSPDVFVAFGCGHHTRRVFRTWVDGGPPVAVFEVTSRSSRRTDQTTKRVRYAEMGVEEYFLFDPLAEYLPGQLRVYRREHQDLVPVVTRGRYLSRLLGLELVVENELLRLVDPVSGILYPTQAESFLASKVERRRADALEQKLRELGDNSRAGPPPR
ncbi:MAG: hypothetical protein AMXMBFR33_34950 [Candidatus Xenobia bacterium]